MRSRDTDIVIVPGLGGSGPEHWQSRWEAKLPRARRVEQRDWEHADLGEWVAALIGTVAQCELPAVVVAHSLGVTTFVHAMGDTGIKGVAGAFLVAPPSDETLASLPAIGAGFGPAPRKALPVPSMLVASRNDPYASFETGSDYAAAWGSTLLDAGEAGHINTDSGHGPWPEGLMAFGGFLNRL